ncbi:hypothetical protein BaRGS_00037022, partial [Batillaria attramentaria]
IVIQPQERQVMRASGKISGCRLQQVYLNKQYTLLEYTLQICFVPEEFQTIAASDYEGLRAGEVIPSDYTCDYTPPETVTTDNCDCADSSNQTFYKFVYQFVADKEKHNGTWDCQPSCPENAVVGGGYLLDNDNSPNCAN